MEGKLACEAIVMCQLVPRQRETSAEPAVSGDESVLEAVSQE